MVEETASIKVLGISGSPRHGATAVCVKEALAAAAGVKGVYTEYISLADYEIMRCDNCNACRRFYTRKGHATFYCSKRDNFLALLASFFDADGYLIGVPVYGYNLPGIFKDFIDRFNCTFPLGRQSKPYAVGGVIALCESRHGGQELVLDAVMDFYAVNQILLYGGSAGRGACVWADDHRPTEVEKDTLGLEQVHALGRGIAEAAMIGARGYQSRKEV